MNIAGANAHATRFFTVDSGVGHCAGHRSLRQQFATTSSKTTYTKGFHNFEFSIRLRKKHARANELQVLCVLAYVHARSNGPSTRCRLHTASKPHNETIVSGKRTEPTLQQSLTQPINHSQSPLRYGRLCSTLPYQHPSRWLSPCQTFILFTDGWP